ncbi:hypothetical protein HZC08_00610 [Candidatus Micrarchaeota archaeon]|nr:hypothetical protein [Candidatus Micrarchaeota archaeon]
MNQGETLEFVKPVSTKDPQETHYRIVLDDLEAHGEVTSAILSILGSDGAVLSKAAIKPGQSRFFDSLGFTISVDEVAPGYTFGAKWAKLTVNACDGTDLTLTKPAVPPVDVLPQVPETGSFAPDYLNSTTGRRI